MLSNLTPALRKDATRASLNSRITFYISGGMFLHFCTEQLYLLYKRINCSVQKNAFFCTRIHKYPE